MTTQADEFQRVHSYLQAQGERHTFSELWSRMIRARVSVMDAVEGVSQEQAEFRPALDEWSIAEVLHHLLTSSEKVATTVEALARGESINPGRIDPPREETTQTIDELTTKLREDSIAWTSLTQRLPDAPPTKPTAPHTMFGELHARAWYLFQARARSRPCEPDRQEQAIRGIPGGLVSTVKIAVNVTSDSAGDWESAASFAMEAERLGAESIWSGESWRFDVITPLAYLSARTEQIGLGTGIVQLGSRSPANLAMTAMSMQSLSGGRFRLGLGTSGPQVMEGWHGVPFSHPISRTREIIEIVRLVTSGERVTYSGDAYKLPLPGGEGRSIRSSAEPVHVPIYVAALGPRNLELTGELADGWIGGSFIPETAEVFLKHLRNGAERAGRKLSDLDLQIPLSVEFTDDVAEAGKRHARGYGFTFGAMGSLRTNFYKDAFARQGFEEAVNEVQRLWMAREREQARDRVPVELATKANLIGTPGTVSDRLKIYRDAGITTLRLGLAGADMGEKLAALGQVMDLVREMESQN